MINIIKKHDNIMMLIIILLVLSAFAFYYQSGRVIDEICNIGNLYKIYNHGKIYVDCNAISTPLFFELGLIFFKLFGANYLVFRSYNYLIFVFLFYITYLLLKELGLHKKYAAYVIIIMTTLFNLNPSNIMYLTAGYNYLALCLYVLGVLIETKCKDSKSNVFLQGIMFFLIFYAKQNIGMLYMIAYVIIAIKEKKKIKNLIISFGIAGILLAISLVRMYYYGNLESFISYAFLGLNEFAGKNSTIIVGLPLDILTIGGYLYTLKIIINKKVIKEKEKENIKKATIFALLVSFAHYPIMDKHHLWIADFMLFVLIAYCFFIVLQIKEKEYQKQNKIISAVMIIIISITVGISLLYNMSYIHYFIREDTIYYGGVLTEKQKNNIENVCNYILKKKEEGIDVKIFSYRAMIYMSRLGINNGDIDEPFYGNLGKEGEAGLKRKIENLKNAEVLITKDPKDICIQEPEKIKEYIIDNFEYVGEIEEFYVYKTE